MNPISKIIPVQFLEWLLSSGRLVLHAILITYITLKKSYMIIKVTEALQKSYPTVK